MPISVTCLSCSAGFKVKDEYAGKRAKCPKCAAPLTIPSPAADFEVVEEPAPKPVVAAKPATAKSMAAKPVVPSKPKTPAVDDEDEKPRSKERVKSEDDEDEKPKGKRKRGDDDTPKGNRRRRNDEAKKKSALPLILGILGGVLVVCVGGCAGVWFGGVQPAVEKAKAEIDAREAQSRTRAGGQDTAFKPPPYSPPTTSEVFPGPDPQPTPNPGNGPPPVPPGAIDARPVVTLNPDELAREYKKYADKHIVLKVTAAFDIPAGTQLHNMVHFPASGKYANLANGGMTTVPIKKGETFEVYGYLQKCDGDEPLKVVECVLLQPSGDPVPVGTILDEFLADKKKATDKYLLGEPPLMSGVVAGKDDFGLVLEKRTVNGKTIVVRAEYVFRTTPAAKVGDKLVFSGDVFFSEFSVNDGQELNLRNCQAPLTYRPPGPPNPIAPTAPTPFDPKDNPLSPAATLSADDLAKDAAKYTDKWVLVTGKAKFGSDYRTRPGEKKAVGGWAAVELEQKGGVPVRFSGGSPFDESLKAKDEAEVWGRVKGPTADGKGVEITDCVAVKPATSVDLAKLSAELLADPKAKDKYARKWIVMTGVLISNGVDGFVIQGSFFDGKMRYVSCAPAFKDVQKKLRSGDVVTLMGDGFLIVGVNVQIMSPRLLSVAR